MKREEQTEVDSSAAECTGVQDIPAVDIEDKHEIQVSAPAVPHLEMPIGETRETEAPRFSTEESSEETPAVSDTELLDGPNQPVLDEYHRKQLPNEKGTREHKNLNIRRRRLQEAS